jgi:hypothetical protein
VGISWTQVESGTDTSVHSVKFVHVRRSVQYRLESKCCSHTWRASRRTRSQSVDCVQRSQVLYPDTSCRVAVWCICVLCWLTDWLIMIGRDYVSEPQPSTGLLFFPQVICKCGKPLWWWCRKRIIPDSSTRALWQSYQQIHLGKIGGWTKEWKICLSVSEIAQEMFNIPQNLMTWDLRLYFPSPLKIRLLGRVRPLGPVASTLTTTPLRRPSLMVVSLTMLPNLYRSHSIEWDGDYEW